MKPKVARKIRTEFKRIKDQEESLIYNLYLIQLLTDTERDILSALHEGLSQKEVCKQRYIGTATMKTHIRNILHRLRMYCRRQIPAVFFIIWKKLRKGRPRRISH